MKDMKAHLERLHEAVADCELIERLATDPHKRATYNRLAAQYRMMAQGLQRDIDKAENSKP
jgi:hypothetical protein